MTVDRDDACTCILQTIFKHVHVSPNKIGKTSCDRKEFVLVRDKLSNKTNETFQKFSSNKSVSLKIKYVLLNTTIFCTIIHV